MRRGRPNIPPTGGVASGALLHSYTDDLDLPTPRGGHFKSITTNERWGSSAREAPAALGIAARPTIQDRSSDEWTTRSAAKEEPKKQSPWDGLGSLDNTERGTMQGFGDSFDPLQLAQRRNMQNVPTIQSPPASTSAASQPQPITSPPITTPQQSRFTMPTPSRLLQAPRPPLQSKPKDSFDGIAPSMSAPSTSNMVRPPSNASQNGLVSAFSRPSTAAESVASTGTGFSATAVVEGVAALSAAERFPSIEQLELGTRERPPPAPIGPRAQSPIRRELAAANRPPMHAGLSRMNYTGGLNHDHDIISPPPPVPMSGVRSQQVTGTAMKGGVPTYPVPGAPGAGAGAPPNVNTNAPPPAFARNSALANRLTAIDRPPSRFPTAERPLAPRRGVAGARKRASTSDSKQEAAPQTQAPRQQQQQPEHDLLGLTPVQLVVTQRTPSPSAMPQRDWLMDDDVVLASIPKASTGSLQPRLPTPDPGYVDPNKAKRATMGTALLYNGRVGLPGLAPPSSVGATVGALNPTRGSMDPPLPGWQRPVSNQSSQTQGPMSPPTITRPSLPRRTSNESSQGATRRRSNTVSRIEPPPPQMPPRLNNQQLRAASPGPPKHSLSDNWSPIERNFPPQATSTFGQAQTGAESSGEEGPEDVNATTLKNLRMRNQVGRSADSYNAGGDSKKPAEQVNRHQGRQGSVHDLVDLRAGGLPPLSAGSQKSHEDSIERAIHRKEPSRDLMNFSEPTQDISSPSSAFNRAAHLFPPLDSLDRRQSPSTGSESEKDTDAPPRQPKRLSTQKFRPSQLSIERTRPQSMFISPGSAPAFPQQSGHSLDDSLSVPGSAGGVGQPNRPRTTRRGSISDMVSRYEALSIVSAATSSATSGYTASTESGTASSNKPKPHISTKPAALRSPAVPSASPVARRVSLLKHLTAQQLSPQAGPSTFSSLDAATSSMQKEAKMSAPVKMRTSPLLFKALESPTDSTHSYGVYSRDRDSATESARGLQPPSSNIERASTPGSNQGAISDANDDILLVSPRPRVTHQPIDYHSEAPLAKAKTPPPAHSPSPEAYKGVSKLIDQWQKKTEEAEGKPRVMKPGGPRLQRKDVLPGRTGAGN